MALPPQIQVGGILLDVDRLRYPSPEPVLAVHDGDALIVSVISSCAGRPGRRSGGALLTDPSICSLFL